MRNPYEASTKIKSSDPDIPERWWWPGLFGVLATPVAMVLAVISHAFGHGDGFADDLLFPLHRPVRILLRSENVAAYIMYFGQFALYGVVLALAARRHRLLVTVSVLVSFHIASFLLRDRIADLLISVRG
ncbi:hypothetical protein [Candidatus Laterigemmans baculatus]|uniref:hypothetical protein n=1 Tax=Candidatus Laterigemmans baculatus TaxID=2770505 RepID=UPI0013D9157E|nr:hypothetical protein [Candidatus Laterigemmans baculatus]